MENIIQSVVGKSYYESNTDHIPLLFKPSIIKSDNVSMPGMEYMNRLLELGDTKVNDELIGKGINSDWDQELVFKHYLKGLKIKHELAIKLGIEDRTSFGDCALGYNMQNHYYIDEFGTSLTTEDPFPDYIVEAAVMFMKNESTKAVRLLRGEGVYDKIDLDDYKNVVASYPRGKNTGLPWVVSGTDRFQNDIVLACNALLSTLFVDGYTSEQVFRDMYLGYLVFSRYQRVAKPIPMWLHGKVMTSTQFEPRRRVVNGTPKAMAMAVKPFVKWWTSIALRMDVFSQDRVAITKRIAQSTEVFASDASRFDLRSGGVKLRQGLQVLWDVAVFHHPNIPPGVYSTMMEEAFLPTLASYGYPDSRVYESSESALRSGASTTSRVGSIINLMYDMMIESERIGSKDPTVLAQYYIRHQPSVILGDDLLKVYDSKNVGKYGGLSSYEDKMKVLEKVGMTVELEKPTKFLGYLIKDKQLYHGTSPLDNMFFPERFNTNPIASLLMRYIILKKPLSTDALAIMTEVMRDEAKAAKWYSAMLKDCGESLAAHYNDHPSGAARMFFSKVKPTADGAWVQKALYSDMDSILTFISKGSSYDFNYALIGLPEMNDLIEEKGDVFTGSINEMIKNAETVARGTSSIKDNGYKNSKAWSTSSQDGAWLDAVKGKRQMDKVNNVLRLFDQKDPDSIINTFHSMLPRIARKTDTFKGPVYTGKL